MSRTITSASKLIFSRSARSLDTSAVVRCLLSAGLLLPFAGSARVFDELSLEKEDTSLLIFAKGQAVHAPRYGWQQKFSQALISPTGSHVGWLADGPYPGGTSLQPLELVVMDPARRLHRFTGDFGHVYGWCFVPSRDAVAYTFRFPHGATPSGFQLRRIRDGRLLASYQLPPTPGEVETSREDKRRYESAVKGAPDWLLCIPEWWAP